jgi:transcriptional regulator with XRE-family HTH domain
MSDIESAPLVRRDWRDRLRRTIEQSGRRHGEIAREAGIDPATLSRILNGHVRQPRFDVVVSIAHASGGRIGWVLHEPGYILSAAQHGQFSALLASLETERGTLEESGADGRD